MLCFTEVHEEAALLEEVVLLVEAALHVEVRRCAEIPDRDPGIDHLLLCFAVENVTKKTLAWLEYSFDICIFLGHGHATSTSGHIVNVLKTATCEE